jgi:hypothetical protein
MGMLAPLRMPVGGQGAGLAHCQPIAENHQLGGPWPGPAHEPARSPLVGIRGMLG